ncbi:MAG: exo-alpha-sialidase [Nitrosomonadales bacterium]|nr:exo-alpha-sialidase [Nitrosomonadales bacterium]
MTEKKFVSPVAGQEWRQHLFRNCSWVGLISCLAVNGVGLAADAASPAPAKPHDMAKMWKTSLARQPVAVTATFDAKGRLWLASVKDGHVMVSHSDDQGKTFSTPVSVNPEPEFVAADGENRPKILVAGNGNIYVSYTQSLETPFAGNVRFSRSVDGGKSFSSPVTVNDNLELFTHRFDSMGVNERGQIYIAWLDKRDASDANKKGEKYSGITIYYAVSDDEGKSFYANIKAADHSCECCRVAMAMDTDGTPVIAWRNIFGKNVRDHAMLRLDGKSQPIRLSYDNWKVDACPHHGPAASIARDGVYHFVWFNNAPERHGLFYAHSSDQGKSFSSPLNFGNFKAQASHPTVLSLGKRVFIAWKEFDGEATGIYLIQSENGGNLWSAPRKIASSADKSDNPLLIDAEGKAYLSWNTVAEGYHLIALPEEAQ